jgi:hypothetical protein
MLHGAPKEAAAIAAALRRTLRDLWVLPAMHERNYIAPRTLHNLWRRFDDGRLLMIGRTGLLQGRGLHRCVFCGHARQRRLDFLWIIHVLTSGWPISSLFELYQFGPHLCACYGCH